MLSSYENEMVLIPSSLYYTPPLKNKPPSPNLLLGVVTGDGDIDSEKNTILTDNYGRVKVRINEFGAQEKIDALTLKQKGVSSKLTSYSYSTFLRVSHPLSSENSGFFGLPRIGMK